MYINVGAYVDEGTMIDSHALVGSCAQIGKRVHLSAAAQVGGVLEPVNAAPVVIEDDVLIAAIAACMKHASARPGRLGSGNDSDQVHATLRSGGGEIYRASRSKHWKFLKTPWSFPARAP